MLMQCQQLEEEWLKKIAELRQDKKSISAPASTKPQSVQLQKYTITSFEGDYKDWIRFWNQLSAEVDGSATSKISKFNSLLELAKGKLREDTLGLPHTEDGDNKPKKMLNDIYGKDIKVHKQLTKEIESLHPITNIHKFQSIGEFYNKLARTVRTLTTMKRLDSAQCFLQTLMDKLGPVREITAQQEDNWEDLNLEELVENMKKCVDGNPL